MSPEQEEALVELLAHIYLATDWHRVKGRSYADVFNHRVRAASRRATLYEAVSKLCNFLGLQSIPEPAMYLVQLLRPAEQEVLHALYTEHIAFTMRAVIKAKEILKTKKRKEELKDEV